MKKLFLSMKRALLPLAGLLMSFALIQDASAMPAFARQTGKACNTCHFQHYPILNEYGMEFKAGGYTDMGKQGEVKGKGLSIPGIFNASLFTKIRYQKDNGKDGSDAVGAPIKTTHSGEIQFPDEFALLIGGRVTDNIGFMMENQFANSPLTGGAGGGFLAGFKLPMTFKVGKGMKAGVTPFLTDGLGAAYGFEQLSTGAVRNIRSNEHRNETSAHQYVFYGGTGPVDLGGATDPVTGLANVRLNAGAASGIAFSLWDPAFQVAYTRWTPHHIAQAGSNVGGVGAGLLRAVWTPTFGDWSLGVGLQSYQGSNMRFLNAGTVHYVDTRGTAFDFQAHGALGNMPLGVYFTHATAPGQAAAVVSKNLFNNNVNTRKATVIMGELGVLPNKATVTLAYRSANSGNNAVTDGGNDSGWTLGGTYQLAQNVQLQLDHSTRTSAANGVGRYGVTNCVAPTCINPTTRGSAMTTFMLSAGF